MLIFMIPSWASMDLARKHYEWGEYDSLLMVSKRLIRDDTLNQDSRAELLKLRAVGFYVQGHLDSAMSSMEAALDVDPNLEADSAFMPTDFYHAFHVAKSKRVSMNSERESPEQEAFPDTAPINYATGPGPTRKLGAWSSWASSAVLAVLATRTFQLAENRFDDLRDAGAAGDTTRYHRLGKEVGDLDAMTTYLGLGSAFMAAVGTYLWFNSSRDVGRERESAGTTQRLEFKFGNRSQLLLAWSF